MYDNSNNMNNGNVNTQNMGVGAPIFSNQPTNAPQQQNVPQQNYDNNMPSPQMDIPPELGKIENLSQSTQYQAPSLDPLEPTPAPVEPQDALSNYEQTGQINNAPQSPMMETVQPVNNYDVAPSTPPQPANYDMAQPMDNGNMNMNTPVPPTTNYDLPINSIEPIQTTQISDQNNFTPTLNYGPQPQENAFLNPVGAPTNVEPAQGNVIYPEQVSPVSIPMDNNQNFNKDSYLVSREESDNVEQEPPVPEEETNPQPEEEEVEETSSKEDMDEIIEDEPQEETAEVLEEDDVEEENPDKPKEKSNVTVEKIKEMIDKLKEEGIKIEVEEFDFEEMYQLVVKIMK